MAKKKVVTPSKKTKRTAAKLLKNGSVSGADMLAAIKTIAAIAKNPTKAIPKVKPAILYAIPATPPVPEYVYRTRGMKCSPLTEMDKKRDVLSLGFIDVGDLEYPAYDLPNDREISFSISYGISYLGKVYNITADFVLHPVIDTEDENGGLYQEESLELQVYTDSNFTNLQKAAKNTFMRRMKNVSAEIKDIIRMSDTYNYEYWDKGHSPMEDFDVLKMLLSGKCVFDFTKYY